MKRLSEPPFIHATASVKNSQLGKYTEVGAECHVHNSTMDDYSYSVGGTQIAYATIGKFANIAANERIYASKHPMQRASLHHFTYRSAMYFEGEEDDAEFFAWRAGNSIEIGHDTWIGHGAVIMPGVKVGNGAIIGSNAVVTKDVADFAIAVGVPAKPPAFPRRHRRSPYCACVVGLEPRATTLRIARFPCVEHRGLPRKVRVNACSQPAVRSAVTAPGRFIIQMQRSSDRDCDLMHRHISVTQPSR